MRPAPCSERVELEYGGPRVFREGTALEALESADSRRFFPQALAATTLTIVVPALVVVVLSPLSGLADLLLSALLATGLSVAAGSAGATLWTRLSQSREIPFGDLMLWSWARRVRAERRLAKAVNGGAPLGPDGELAQLRTLAVVFEARDGFSHGHSGRVARHAERIEAAAAVHDIGMVRVPRSVLERRGQADLTAEERELLERHAVAGAEQVAAVADPEIATLVRHLHERVDGSGYPDGLAGDEIPLGARIIAVADRADELIAPASQQSLRGRRNALDELSARAGSELDAAVVATFVGYYSARRSIAGVALAATAPQRAVRWLAAAPGATIGAAGAPIALQSMCAAGATVLAGACLTGIPMLSPERDGDRAATGQQAGQAAGAGAADGPELASAAPGMQGGSGDDNDRGASGRRGGGGEAPSDGAPQAPSPTSPGSGGTPVAPPSGGGAPPSSGGAGGGGSGGGTSPTPSPSTNPSPPAAIETPQVPSAPQPDTSPVSQVVDPVLDGVSDAVPPAKPVTDIVKGVVGGLAGGLGGGSAR